MKLYQNPMSPPCRRVLAAVYHLNTPVEMQTIDFRSGELSTENYFRMNPNGAVPLLEEGDFHLWESTAIMQYLAEKKGDTDFYPKDLKKRADINRWTAWALCHFGPASGTIVWENFVKQLFDNSAPDEKALLEATEDFHKYAKVLDQQLAKKKFVTGDVVTVADFTIGSNIMYWKQARMPLENYRNILGWYDRLEATDAWKKSTPPSV